MRVIWSSTGQRKELASKETKWNRFVENDPLTLDNFISFNRTYICLINGEVVSFYFISNQRIKSK